MSQSTFPVREGQNVPQVSFRVRRNGDWATVTTDEIFGNKNVVVFSLPGAYTPTCSSTHLPRFNELWPAFKAQGIDAIVCLSVNDPFVMKAWGAEHGALGKVVMLADGNATFTKALGIEVDLAGPNMGLRARRGLLTIEDGVVKTIDMEAPGKFEVSSAAACALKF